MHTCRLRDRFRTKPFSEQSGEARRRLNPGTGAAEAEAFALQNFTSVQPQIRVRLQNYLMHHFRPVIPADLLFAHRFAWLPNRSTGREGSGGEANFLASHCVLGLSFISNNLPLPQIEKITGLRAPDPALPTF